MNKTTLEELISSSHLSGQNAAFIEAWYEDWLEDPDSVPGEWARVFAALADRPEDEQSHLAVKEKFRLLGRLPANIGATEASESKEAAVVKLITAYRIRGHEAARLDPLGEPHYQTPPDLDPAYHGLESSDLEHEFDTAALFAPDRMKLRDIIELCQRVYTGSIGIEAIHISDTSKRRWLQERLESGGGHYDVSDAERVTEAFKIILSKCRIFRSFTRFATFSSLINSLGGLRVDIREEVRDSSYHHKDSRGIYFPAKDDYKLKGDPACKPYPKKCRSALVYARSRKGTQGNEYNSDWKRAERQQEMVRAAVKNIIDDGAGIELVGRLLRVRDKVDTNIPKTVEAAGQLYAANTAGAIAGAEAFPAELLQKVGNKKGNIGFTLF